jgi:uncharacterized protein YndB with AHSA1/START domain
MDDMNYRKAIEREIVIVRVIDAQRERVFDAWTKPEAIMDWYGPDGISCDTRSIDVAVDGRWCFDMIGPGGQRFSNRMTFLELTSPSRLVIDHGQDIDDESNRFLVTVTFDEQADEKTVRTMRQLHPTPAARVAMVSFGAVEFAYQTLGTLVAYVNSPASSGR